MKSQFHLFTVESSTLYLLQEIFSLERVNQSFALAGGTSLALQIGHRYSIDLDIFSEKPFDTKDFDIEFAAHFTPEYLTLAVRKYMLFTRIKGVKCDFVVEPSKTIRPKIEWNGIWFYSIEDIAAMKMHTIAGRGKKKDFFDIYALLQLFTWDQMLSWFQEKYGSNQFYFLWRSITYFTDAERDPDIKGFGDFDVSWDEIKSFIRSTCA